jgi:hypothetical protein
MEGYRDYWVKNAVRGDKKPCRLSTVPCKNSSPRQEIATDLDGDQVKC